MIIYAHEAPITQLRSLLLGIFQKCPFRMISFYYDQLVYVFNAFQREAANTMQMYVVHSLSSMFKGFMSVVLCLH